MPDDPYFTVAEARALVPLDNETLYTDELIDAAREAAEEALERECAVAFVPRTATVTLDGPGGCDLLLPDPRPTEVTDCTVGGTALDADALSALVLYRDGRVFRRGGWPAGRASIVATYTHGYESVPGLVKSAALKLAKWLLVDSPVSSRVTQMQTDDGTTQFFGSFQQRQPFSVEEANAVVRIFGVSADVG